MSRVSVGVIGLGRMGRMHSRVFSELTEHFQWVGAFDPRNIADATFPSPDALIEAASLVVVAAPTADHDALVRAALERGRAVLVEKPLASSTVAAKRLAEFADSRGCPLFVGHSERFNPVVRAISERLRVFSRAPLVTAIAIDRFVPGSSLASEEDVLLNLGVHDLDLVEHLTGAHAVVLGATGDASSSRVHLSAGLVAVTLRCGRDGDRKRQIRVTTAETILEGDLLSPRLVAVDRRTERYEAIALRSEEALRGQALAIHAALSGSNELAETASGHQGARAVELAELAMALRDRKRTPIAHDSAQP